VTFAVLLVCTGNICRSPAGEHLLRTKLGEVPDLQVSSAGTRAMHGAPIEPAMKTLLLSAGVTVGPSRARQLTSLMLEETDLVLTMTHSHRSEVVTLNPHVVRRAFTLREFAAILESPRSIEATDARTPIERLAEVTEWAARHRSLASHRPAARLDVIDPYRRSNAIYRRSFDQIAPAIESIVLYLNK
jgi:protein-tyrosine phosphatase